MADVSGSELVYNYEGERGVATWTFRKRRYVFPSVVVTDKATPRSTSPCLMLDVGLYCPHCTGTITGQISGSHSKLTISKRDSASYPAIGCDDPHLSTGYHEGRTAQWQCDNVATAPRSRSQHANIKQIKPKGLKPGKRSHQSVRSGDQDGPHDSHGAFDLHSGGKQSSSDYESLDRDSTVGNNTREQTASSLPYASCEQSSNYGNAYSAVTSSDQEHVFDGNVFWGKPEPYLNSETQSSCTRHDPSHIDSTSEQQLSREYCAGEYSQEVDPLTKDFQHRHVTTEKITTAERPEPRDVFGSDEDRSDCKKGPGDRSASPETFVDDILENVAGEVFSVDATLPRVFSLRSDHSKKHSHRKSRKPPVPHISHSTGIYHRRNENQQTSNQVEDIICMKPMKIETSNDMDKVKGRTDPKIARNQLKSSYSHEEFFEDVLEALAELEEGFATSDYDSDSKDATLSTPESGQALHHHDNYMYTDNLVRYNSQGHTQDIASDRLHDVDMSVIDTPPAGSSVQRAGSSAAPCSNVLSHAACPLESVYPSKNRSVLATQERKDLNVQPKEQYDITDEVFLVNKHDELRHTSTLETEYLSHELRFAKPSVVPSNMSADLEAAAMYCSNQDVDHTGSDDSENSSINESSSLEHLLTSNELHCSTSDLDEPYTAELEHNGIRSVPGDSNNGAECTLLEDDSKVNAQSYAVINSQSAANDDEPKVVLQTQDGNQHVAPLVGNHRITYNSSDGTNVDIDITDKSYLETQLQSVEWKDFTSEADTKIASFESKDTMSKEQAQQFLKYVLHKSSHEEQSHSHTSDLDACLDEVCQTCELKPKAKDEIVKHEEVTTQEVTFVFAWPKKLAKGKQLLPKCETSQPFRTVHLRRVMRVSDFDMETVDGPTVETLEYTKEGTESVKVFERPLTPELPLCPKEPDSKEDGILDAGRSQDDDLPEVNSGISEVTDRHIAESDQPELNSGISEVTDRHIAESDQPELNSGISEVTDRSISDSDLPELISGISQVTDRDIAESNQPETSGISQVTDRDIAESDQPETSGISEVTDRDIAESDQPETSDSSEVTDRNIAESDQPETSDISKVTDRNIADESTLPNRDGSSHGNRYGGAEPASRDLEREHLADPIFIKQRERNIKLLNIGNYFSPSSNSADSPDITAEDHDQIQKEHELKRPLFVLQPSKHTDNTCSDCLLRTYPADRTIHSSGRASGHPLSHPPPGHHSRHPLVCQRCLMLEREVKQKLKELSSMVEGMGSAHIAPVIPETGAVISGTNTCTAISSQYPKDKTTDRGLLAICSEFPAMGRRRFQSLPRESNTEQEIITRESVNNQQLINEIKLYAENLSKYILFRSKLFIVLNKATTNTGQDADAVQNECTIDDVRTE